jgi:hypothetical protein
MIALRLLVGCLGVSLVSTAAPTIARAQTPPPRPSLVDAPPASPEEWEALRRSRLHEVWYGWQTLAFDGGSVGVALLGGRLGAAPVPFAIASAAMFELGPPAVHVAHRNFAAALGSLALRVAMPLVGYALGVSLGGTSTSDLEKGIVPAVGGAAGAAALDAAVLAWDRWQGSERVGRPIIALRGSF